MTNMTLLEALEAAVAERGTDYVYPFEDLGWTLLNNGSSCRYTLDDGSPACIIGLAASKMGIDPTNFEEGRSAEEVLESLVTDRECEAADMAQNMQDSGKTWGEALEIYKEAMKNA